MGVDFLKSKAGSFSKSWSKGGQRICAPDFFASNPDFANREILVHLSPGATAEDRERLLLVAEADAVSLYRENSKLACLLQPPEDILAALKNSAGCTVVRVKKYLRRPNAVRLAIEE